MTEEMKDNQPKSIGRLRFQGTIYKSVLPNLEYIMSPKNTID